MKIHHLRLNPFKIGKNLDFSLFIAALNPYFIDKGIKIPKRHVIKIVRIMLKTLNVHKIEVGSFAKFLLTLKTSQRKLISIMIEANTLENHSTKYQNGKAKSVKIFNPAKNC